MEKAVFLSVGGGSAPLNWGSPACCKGKEAVMGLVYGGERVE